MPPMILTDAQRMGLISGYVGGAKIKDLIKPLAISERTGFNMIARVGVHRCRCGDIHIKDVGVCVWALEDSPSQCKKGAGGRIVGVSAFRVAIKWNGSSLQDVIDTSNAGKLFTFKRELELFR